MVAAMVADGEVDVLGGGERSLMYTRGRGRFHMTKAGMTYRYAYVCLWR